MIAKLIVWDADRDRRYARMREALAHYRMVGAEQRGIPRPAGATSGFRDRDLDTATDRASSRTSCSRNDGGGSADVALLAPLTEPLREERRRRASGRAVHAIRTRHGTRRRLAPQRHYGGAPISLLPRRRRQDIARHGSARRLPPRPRRQHVQVSGARRDGSALQRRSRRPAGASRAVAPRRSGTVPEGRALALRGAIRCTPCGRRRARPATGIARRCPAVVALLAEPGRGRRGRPLADHGSDEDGAHHPRAAQELLKAFRHVVGDQVPKAPNWSTSKRTVPQRGQT